MTTTSPADAAGTIALTMATHQVVLTLQGVLPPHLVLWGRESAVMEHGLDLTEPVAASLDALVDTVAGELRAWGAAV